MSNPINPVAVTGSTFRPLALTRALAAERTAPIFGVVPAPARKIA